MSIIEKIQVLIRSDRIHDMKLIRLVRLQQKHINKLPLEQQQEVLDSLWDIEPRPLTKRDIDRLLDEIHKPKKTEITHTSTKQDFVPVMSYKQVPIKQTRITLNDKRILKLLQEGYSPEAISTQYRQPFEKLKNKCDKMKKAGLIK